MSIKSLRTGVAAAMGGAVLLAGLVVGASIALAEEADEPEVTTEGETPEECGRYLRERFHMFRGQLGEIVEELGLDPEQIQEQIAGGATLAEIAEDAGVDLDSLLAEARDKAFDAIDERVAAGDLSEERAAEMKERIESFDPGEVNFRFGHPRSGMPRLGGFLGDVASDLDLSELRDKLESGMTLDEALDDLGVDVDGMLEEARDRALDHIDEMVADGTITQDRAAELKEMIEGFEMGEGFPFGPRGFRFHFDSDEFEEFDFDGFRWPRRQNRGFFGDGAENALLNV